MNSIWDSYKAGSMNPWIHEKKKKYYEKPVIKIGKGDV